MTLRPSTNAAGLAVLGLLVTYTACDAADGCSSDGANAGRETSTPPGSNNSADRRDDRTRDGSSESGAEKRPASEVVGTFEETDPAEGTSGSLKRVRSLISGDRFKFGDHSLRKGSPWITVSTWANADQKRQSKLTALQPAEGTRRNVALKKGAGGWSRDQPDLVVLHPDGALRDVAFFDLSQGKRLDPTFELPDDLPRDEFELRRVQATGTAEDHPPRVWLSGRYGDANYAAVWRPGDETSSFREISIPYDELAILGRNGDDFYVTDRAFVTPGGRASAQGGCAFWRVPTRGEPSCGVELLHGDRPDRVEYLGDGWVLLSTWGTDYPRLIGPEQRRIRLGLGMCSEPFVLGWRTGTPGAVVSCFGSPRSSGQTYEYWAPKQHFQFVVDDAAPPDRRIRTRSRATGTTREPIVWQWWGGDRDRTDHWFDFRRGRYWKSRELFPLPFGYRRARSPVLAADEKTGEQLDVFALDFKEGTRRKLVTYDDCPGALRQRDRAGRYALLDCVVQPDSERFRFELVWTEWLDLRDGTHARIEGYPHAVFANGTAVVSNRSLDRPGHYEAADELWVVAPQ